MPVDANQPIVLIPISIQYHLLCLCILKDTNCLKQENLDVACNASQNGQNNFESLSG